jgi:hypothetical protein
MWVSLHNTGMEFILSCISENSNEDFNSRAILDAMKEKYGFITKIRTDSKFTSIAIMSYKNASIEKEIELVNDSIKQEMFIYDIYRKWSIRHPRARCVPQGMCDCPTTFITTFYNGETIIIASLNAWGDVLLRTLLDAYEKNNIVYGRIEEESEFAISFSIPSDVFKRIMNSANVLKMTMREFIRDYVPGLVEEINRLGIR